MEKFYLEKPTINRKNDAIEYIREHIDTNSKINGTGGLNRLIKGFSYEEWLDDVIKSEDNEYTKFLKEHDIQVSSSVTKNTNYVITDNPNGTSTKLKKAKELNIPIISEQQMDELIRKE